MDGNGKDLKDIGGPSGLLGTGAGCAWRGQAASAVGRRDALSPRTDSSGTPVGGRGEGLLREAYEDVTWRAGSAEGERMEAGGRTSGAIPRAVARRHG